MTGRLAILALVTAALSAAAATPAAAQAHQSVHFDSPGLSLSVRPSVPPTPPASSHGARVLTMHGGGGMPSAATSLIGSRRAQGAALLLPAIQAAREAR